MNVDIQWDRVSIDGQEIRVQYSIDDSIVRRDGLILRLVQHNDPLENYDIAVEDPGRNVIPLTPSGELKWVIEALEATDEDGVDQYIQQKLL